MKLKTKTVKAYQLDLTEEEEAEMLRALLNVTVPLSGSGGYTADQLNAICWDLWRALSGSDS